MHTQILLDKNNNSTSWSQEELLKINLNLDNHSSFFPINNITKLEPCFDNTIEDIGLELITKGNYIIKAKVLRGYFFADIEENLAQLSINEAIIYLGKLNIHMPIFYQTALIKALDNLFSQQKTNISFGIAMEWARIFHHITVLKKVSYCLKLSSLANRAENIISLIDKPIMELCRVHINTINLTYSFNYLCKLIKQIEMLFKIFESSFFSEKKIHKKLHNRWKISQTEAGSFGLSGLFLRANRYNIDIRKDHPSIYENTPQICYGEGKDAWSRLSLRIQEINASLSWLKQFIHKKNPHIYLNNDDYKLASNNLWSYAEIEGPEGIIKITIFNDIKNHCLSYKIRSPAYFIAQLIPSLLENSHIKDMALLLYSLGINGREIDL